MKNNRRQGKKTAVTEEDIPTPETKNRRYVGPVTRMRARYAGDDWEREDDLSTDPTRPAYAGDDWERVTLDKSRKVNAAGKSKSAAGSTSLNTKRLQEDTGNLAFNAAGKNKSAAAGSTSLNTKRLHEDTENLAFNAAGKSESAAAEVTENLVYTYAPGRISIKYKRPEWQHSRFPPSPPEAKGWRCYRIGTLREDAKEAMMRSKRYRVEDEYDFEYVWEEKPPVPSDIFEIRPKKLCQAALAMRRKRLGY